MPEFTITFKTPSSEAMNASISALAEIYGGYKPEIPDPDWQRDTQSRGPQEPPKISNPESIEDFVKRNLLLELTSKVVSHNSAKAAQEARIVIQQSADSFTVE